MNRRSEPVSPDGVCQHATRGLTPSDSLFTWWALLDKHAASCDDRCMINTPKRQCEGIVRFSLSTNGTDEQIIALADSLSLERYGQGIDSLDLGDAMGLFMRVAHDDFYAGELMLVYPGIDFMVEMDIEHDLFIWQ